MERVSINLLEVGDKARSKSELYKILTVEGGLYLPPYKFWSVDFMADILEGNRNVSNNHLIVVIMVMQALESKDVAMRVLPHIAGLRTEDLLKFLIWECDAESYLPPRFNEINLYREWIGNLCKEGLLLIN